VSAGARLEGAGSLDVSLAAVLTRIDAQDAVAQRGGFMKVFSKLSFVIGGMLLVPALMGAGLPGQDADRKVAGGGVTAKGWTGAVDAKAASAGMTIKDSKFEQTGDTFHLTIGPAAVYWNPANMASGDYTVKATFTEPKQMINHAHPMGLFIGGSKLGTPEQTLLYCTAYRNGNFIVRGFNGTTMIQTPFSKPTPNAAVKKAATTDDPVTQEIAWVVKGGRAECMVNGTSVAGFDKADIVGAGKLESLDGVYGIRVSHNMDLTVSKLQMTKN
jgi:hypothetical protein